MNIAINLDLGRNKPAPAITLKRFRKQSYRLLFFIGIILASGTVQAQIPPFNIFWNVSDDNSFPKNPKWGWQKIWEQTGVQPDYAQLCPSTFGFNPFRDPCYTTQSPTYDPPLFGFNPNNWALGGHVNWFPVTFEGQLFWQDHTPPGQDDDYNFVFLPINASVKVNGSLSWDFNKLHLEFDSDETIDHFHTKWWEEFRDAVDDGDDAAKEKLGKDGTLAIVTGLMGLDCSHDCMTELHPVWAMAIRVTDDPSNERWAIFVRNWGNQGFVSINQHELPLPSNVFTFRLPWRQNADAVTMVSSEFLCNNNKVSGPYMEYTPNKGVLIKFTLAPPGERSRLNGELTLNWAGTNIGPPFSQTLMTKQVETVQSLRVGAREKLIVDSSIITEERLAVIIKNMDPAMREAYLMKVAVRERTFDKIVMKKGKSVKRLRELPDLRLVKKPPLPRPVYDRKKVLRDSLRLQVLKSYLKK